MFERTGWLCQIYVSYLVGGLEPWNFMFHNEYVGMSSSQLTKSIIFQDGCCTTNQYICFLMFNKMG